MKLLSYNFHGLASPENKKKKQQLAFRRLLSIERVDVIFLQETLGLAETISHLLESMLPGWHFHALDVHERSGGIMMGYNSRTIKLCNICGGIELSRGKHLFI